MSLTRKWVRVSFVRLTKVCSIERSRYASAFCATDTDGRFYTTWGNAPLYPPSVALEQRARPRWESFDSVLSFSFDGERPRRFSLRNAAIRRIDVPISKQESRGGNGEGKKAKLHGLGEYASCIDHEIVREISTRMYPQNGCCSRD